MTAATQTEPRRTLILPEADARRLLLVQALDGVDSQGKLLSQIEREQIEERALHACREAGSATAPDPELYLQARAQQMLVTIENRNPRVAALQHAPGWRRVLAWGLPLLALLMGAVVDRIDNPHQVNLLSPPLLAFVLWNLLIYAGLFLWPLLPRPARAGGFGAGLQRWLAAGGLTGRRTGSLRADVATQFHLLWLRVCGPLEAHRVRQLLHTSAMAWALGVALSIAIGGLVREYRVGWESTLLDLPQVHAFLRILFAPVVALLPFDAFSMAELERMHFRSGVEVGRLEARRWVGLYIGLLLLLVAAPRALLAAYSGWRVRRLARAVRINLAEPYFDQVMGRVSPARVLLCLLPGDASGTEVLLQVMGQAARRPRPSAQPQDWAVLDTARGDELRLMEMLPDPHEQPPPPATDPGPIRGGLPGVIVKWWKRPAAPPQHHPVQRARAEADLVLFPAASAAQLRQATPWLQWLGKPVLVLLVGERLDAGTEAAVRAAAQGLDAQLLPLADCAQCWFQEGVLLDAIARPLPSHKTPGMARLAQAWQGQHQARLAESMRLLATELVDAARQSEEVGGSALNLKRLVSAPEREAGQVARREAMSTVLERLRQTRGRSHIGLLRLHGVEIAAGAVQAAPPAEQFVLRQAVDSPQAGLAGAASGAAFGATVDLMLGGLTLGAATALGALLGGGAAFVAAAWKNRTTPSGISLLQLSDEMLQTLTESALVGYLAVIHLGRATQSINQEPAWKSEVVAAVEAAREQLEPLWAQARSDSEAGRASTALAHLLQDLSLRILARLYRDAAAPV